MTRGQIHKQYLDHFYLRLLLRFQVRDYETKVMNIPKSCLVSTDSKKTLKQVFHWSRPCNQPYDSRVSCKSRAEPVMKSPTGRYNYRQAIMTFPTRRRVGDVFCTASRRSTTTSPKPLTDKLDKKQTSCKDKQTSREDVPDPSRQK